MQSSWYDIWTGTIDLEMLVIVISITPNDLKIMSEGHCAS